MGYLKASNTETADQFGQSISLSADSNTFAVGAQGEDSCATGINGNQADNNCSGAGAVYVFKQTAGLWSQQAYVKASNTEAVDIFGSSVALSADGSTLAVGAREGSCATGVNGNQADNNCSDAGAVYVFTRTNSAWSQQAYVKASNTGVEGFFGRSVALSADGNTLAIGSAGEDSCATGINGNQTDNACYRAGAVYVFTRTAGTWTQQAYVKASNNEAVDSFGSSVALSGNTLAIGANGEDSCATGINGNQADNSCESAGAVYVFTRTNSTWSQQAYVKASNTNVADAFGYSVALSDDTLAVSALSEDSCATGINGNQADNICDQAGGAYVFTRTAGAWSQQAYVKASNTEVQDQFGYSVALSGNTLAIGANEEGSCATGVNGNQSDNSCQPNAGAVYVFTRAGDVWTQQAYVKASNTEAVDIFGSSVALSGGTLAVSAPNEGSCATGLNGNQADNICSGAGAVY